MKKLGLVVALVVSGHGSAHADLADSWPEAYVDRPLVLLPGMTELAFDLQTHSTTTHTLGVRTADLGVGHAFGPLELGADLGEYAELHAAVATGTMPEVIEVDSAVGAQQFDGSWHLGQAVSVGQRLHFVPGRFSVRVAGGASLGENRYRDAAQMLAWSQVVSVFGNADAELQLARHVAVFAGSSVAVPLASSPDLGYRTSLTASGGFLVSFGHWDFYANAGFIDVIESRLLSVNGGFTHRWGR